MNFLLQDWSVNADPKSKLVLSSFRLAHSFALQKHRHTLVWIIGLPILVLYRITVEWLLNIELPPRAQIGPGLKLRHGQGLVIHPETKIGANVTLRHSTTIGNKNYADGLPSQAPILEDNVDVGCHVVIIGPITIGQNAVIGAGSVVVKDVSPNSVVAGNPARVIATRTT